MSQEKKAVGMSFDILCQIFGELFAFNICKYFTLFIMHLLCIN